jgi:hypothetical protein
VTWFDEQRQAWISESLRVYGFINRRHVQMKFGVSSSLASLDLRQFLEANPDAATYNTSEKTYEANAGRGERARPKAGLSP